jgi:hypothetical protein
MSFISAIPFPDRRASPGWRGNVRRSKIEALCSIPPRGFGAHDEVLRRA